MHTTVPAHDFQIVADKITHTIVAVSSDAAKRWLTANRRNRPVNPAQVGKYRIDMAHGRWQFAADPIRFDINGDLIDGQHRLTALSELPGITLPMLVIRGLPNETQRVMDQGLKRTPGQQLSLSNIKDANLVAAIVRVVILWETGLMFRDNTLQRQEVTTAGIEEWVDDNPDDVELMQAMATPIRSVDAPPSAVGAFLIIAARTQSTEASDFLNQLHQMTGLSEGHPVHTLYRRLAHIRKQSTRYSTRDYLALFIQAFNHFHQGHKVMQLPRPKGGSWTVDNFPEVTK